ncbi:MAG: TadE/TadG family type IV pilus assembly protein [Aureliella sp.]
MRHTQRRTRSARRGTATVEMAIVLPVLIALVFGSIEICQRLHVKQSALIAAYEACRVATRPISDTADVQTHAETLLTQQDVKQATVSIRNMTQAKNNINNIVTGDEIRIRVDVPWGANTVSHYVIGDSAGSFRVEAFMLRE